MKRIITLTLIMCSLLLSACDNASIGVIGGADGPTEIVVGKIKNENKGQFGEQLEKKEIRMFNVDGDLYYDSGLISENTPRCGVMDGELKKTVADGEIRIKELDRLIEKVYEDNALGRIDDDRYRKLMAKYEREQKELAVTVSEGQETLKSAEQKSVDLRLLLRTFREMTDIQELTPTLVNSLIERIEVHNNDKSSGHCFVKVDIYFTGVGMICIPTEEEVIAMMEEARKNPQEYRIVA